MKDSIKEQGLYERFKLVYEHLLESNKVTNISNGLGYTTTRQLYNVLDGSSTISTKALIQLFRNYNVNPNYLFLGVSPTFTTDEEFIDSSNRIAELEEENVKLRQGIGRLDRMTGQLEEEKRKIIEVTYEAIQSHKTELNIKENIEPELTAEEILKKLESK